MENSRFFDSTTSDKRSYSAEDFAEYLRTFYSDGIINNSAPDGNTDSESLLVARSSGTLSITVNQGHAMIRGYWYHNDAKLPLQVTAADTTYARIDRVVLRLDLTTREIAVKILSGIPAAVPSAPSLTRNDNIYDLALAKLTIPANATVVTSVVDERSDASVCGYMQGHYTIGLKGFEAQLDEIIAQAEEKSDEAVQAIVNLTNETLKEKIKSLDGAGSGIDADLLDGQHGSYYRDYENLTNKPTVEDLGGRTILAGTGSPASSLGKDGDIYIQYS